ncbi:MAG: hypothetical protein AAFV53_13775 [Myxococcota bacterium]
MRTLSLIPLFVSFPLVSSGCVAGFFGAQDCEPSAAGQPGDPIALSALACMTRADAPIFRDPIPSENYEAASDGHVFRDQRGALRMIYSGDHEGTISIKLADGQGWDRWSANQTLLGEPGPDGQATNKETAFYRLADDGTHQLYFIGYDDEEAYHAEVYLAEASALEGPWTILPEPVVPRGMQAGRDVYLITSPSVVEHDGQLMMTYLGWNGFADVTAVWALGAISTDNGRTWGDVQEIDAPIGMEGQITKGPDGRFYAARTGEFGDVDGIAIGVADHPFGPYEVLPDPVLTLGGAPFETHEIIAPQLFFDASQRTAYLYYTGADHQQGWWMMMASARY